VDNKRSTIIVLSARQAETLLYTAAGRSKRDIGLLLGIKPATVRTHQERLTAKLDAINLQHAVSRALMLGAITHLEALDTAAGRQPGTRLRSTSNRRPRR
jgi:DNA-binding CsgD family transcriptional regulator